MNESKSPMHYSVYFVVGLLALIVLVNVLSGILRLISFFVSAVLTIALAVLVGYIVYRLLRSVFSRQ